MYITQIDHDEYNQFISTEFFEACHLYSTLMQNSRDYNVFWAGPGVILGLISLRF